MTAIENASLPRRNKRYRPRIHADYRGSANIRANPRPYVNTSPDLGGPLPRATCIGGVPPVGRGALGGCEAVLSLCGLEPPRLRRRAAIGIVKSSRGAESAPSMKLQRAERRVGREFELLQVGQLRTNLRACEPRGEWSQSGQSFKGHVQRRHRAVAPLAAGVGARAPSFLQSVIEPNRVHRGPTFA